MELSSQTCKLMTCTPQQPGTHIEIPKDSLVEEYTPKDLRFDSMLPFEE